ncbi:MAG: DUF748 domain-containing protein [Pseudomonadales bacterium]
MYPFFRDAGAYLRSHAAVRRGLIGLLVFGLLRSAALVALPMVVAAYAEDWLRENGAADARIDDVDINPFTARVRVTGLVAGEKPGAELRVEQAEIDLRWWPLTSRRAFVDLLRLQGVRADVVAREDGSWQIGALLIAPAPDGADADVDVETPEGPTWGFGSELVNLRDVNVSYVDGVFDTRVDVRELRVGSQFSWDAGRSTTLVVDLTVDGSPLVLRSDVVPWAEEPSLSGRLTLADLDLADFASELKSLAGLEGSRGVIAMDLEIAGRLDADGVLRIGISGPFNLNDAGFAVGGAQVAHDALRWDGVIDLALPAQAEEPLVRLDGALQLTGVAASAPEQALAARLGDLRWDGTLALSPPPEDGQPLVLSSEAGALLRDLELRHTGLDAQLLALTEARAEGLAITGPGAANLAGLRLQGLRLLPGGAPGDGTSPAPDLLDVAELTLEGVAIDAATVTVDVVRIDEPALVLVRTEDGAIERLSAVLAAFDGDGAEAAAGAPDATLERTVEDAEVVADADAVADATPPFTFDVGRVEITGTRWLDVRDRSVAPAADFQLAELRLIVDDVSSRGAQPMRIDLLTSDDNTRLTVAGTLGVFSETLSADLAVNLENLEMPPLSPYVPGYDVFRGRLSTETRVSLQGDALDIDNDLLIERLKLAGKGGEGDDLLSQGMAMPVDVALDLLRDRDDRIRLELPVTGSLSNPQFGTGDIVRQAMQKALQNAAMSYVKNALQPLGTLLLVGNLAAQAARPRFEPVAMTAGDSALPPSGRDYLGKLSDLLEERPGLALTICGVATAADRQALVEAALARRAADAEAQAPAQSSNAAETAVAATAEAGADPAVEPPPPQISDAALLELAGLRTSRVIGELAGSGAVSRERLFACRESIDTDADAMPRVEITL